MNTQILSKTEVSEVEIVPVKPRGGLIGFASFVLDGKYYVGSVAIFTKVDGTGYRLLYPARKIGEKSINIFHPITKETGESIEKAVTNKFIELFNASSVYEQ